MKMKYSIQTHIDRAARNDGILIRSISTVNTLVMVLRARTLATAFQHNSSFKQLNLCVDKISEVGVRTLANTTSLQNLGRGKRNAFFDTVV